MSQSCEIEKKDTCHIMVDRCHQIYVTQVLPYIFRSWSTINPMKYKIQVL